MESSNPTRDEAPSRQKLELFADIRDENALWLAVKDGQQQLFLSLLQAGVPMSGRVLRLIFDNFTTQGFKYLETWRKEGGLLNEFYDGATPLKIALGHDACVQWLLDHAADPNKQPQVHSEVDLLTLAAAKSPPSVVKLLIDYGARARGTQALHAAATTSAIETDPGYFRSVPSRIEVLCYILEHGGDVNEMEPDPKILGRPRAPSTGTPLHRAVKYGSIEAVQCLLTYGADVSARSWSGLTALEAAHMYHRQDIIDAIGSHSGQAKD